MGRRTRNGGQGNGLPRRNPDADEARREQERLRRREEIRSAFDNAVRPVFDPGLPAGVVDRLRRNPSFLLGETETVARWSGHRGKLLMGGLTVASVGLAWLLGSSWLMVESPGGYLLGLLVHATVVAAGAIAAVRVAPYESRPALLHGKRALRWWIWTGLSVLPLTIVSWILVPAWPWLFFGYAPTAVCTAAALWVAFGWTRNERLAVAHVRRYLVPKDFDERGTALLVGVQQTVSTVEEAGERLGDSFDAAHPLHILRAEEWRIASTLYRYQRLRAETRTELAEATSDRVKAVLAHQRQQQETVYRELASQSDRILEYRAAVEEVLRAHAEWEQIERAEMRDDRITDLRSRVSQSAHTELLKDEEVRVRAAARVRDELLDRLTEAGKGLTAAVGRGT
ncbi:hypothetical protein [Nocardiopsis sp. CC223A]|uniref:hypothetical protein n=1 Tax=Nocardiopsis sp. CC223A TaxID=3044051 RepID=UPI0027959DD4|nr:hypothetical protein [Nocardiopsis sp. CC223A]